VNSISGTTSESLWALTTPNAPQRRSVAQPGSGSLIDSLVERNRRARELVKLRRGLWLIIELLERF
jgi:hypothetical protein